jgi:hypothetical protein
MKTLHQLRNIVSVILLSMITIQMVNAQQKTPPTQKKKDMIEAQKVAYITQQLNLTPKESQAFWPVYNEYQNKLRELNKTHRSKMQLYATLENPTEKQAEEIVDAQIIHEQNMLDLKKAYLIQFKAALPEVKIVKLYKAEADFKKFLLKQLKEKRKEGIK